MANLQVVSVTKSYGSKKLFEDVTVNFTVGKRYGLTGPNGAGKSTFMKILAGDLEPDTGNVSRPEKTSVLRQEQFGFEDVRVLDVVLRGNKRLWAAMDEKEEILALPDITDEQGQRLGELEGIIAEEDGYTRRVRRRRAARRASAFPPSALERPMRELAGGLRLRVLLAQALFGKPEVLLLDEPTNNLDLDSIRWLESFLCEYEGVLVTISHDRHFLNAICTHVADIDYKTIITYTGGYDDMVDGQEPGARPRRVGERRSRARRSRSSRTSWRASAPARAPRRCRAARRRSRSCRSPTSRSRTSSGRSSSSWSSKPVGQADAHHRRADQDAGRTSRSATTSRRWSPRARRSPSSAPTASARPRCAACSSGELAPDAGTIEWGHEVSVGYIAQDHGDSIPKDTTVDQWLHSFDDARLPAGHPRPARQDAVQGRRGAEADRGALGRRGGAPPLRQADADQGQRAGPRRADQPPRPRVDRGARRRALRKYEGTAFVVTHDRDLIASFATRLFAFDERGLIDFRGTYDEYLAQRDGGSPRKRR